MNAMRKLIVAEHISLDGVIQSPAGLMIYPVMLERGKHLFGDDIQPSALTLVHSIGTPSDVLLARYARSGEVRTGRADK